MNYTSDRQAIRPLSVLNATPETIPGYACMMLADAYTSTSKGFGTIDVNGVATWRVQKCDKKGEQYQNPALFFFNGPTPIPPYASGSASRTFPAQTLHDGRKEGLNPGRPCGPKQDEWWVSNKGWAFTCMGHTKTDEGWRGSQFDNIHTVWVTNEQVGRITPYFSGSFSTTASPGGLFDVGGAGQLMEATTVNGLAAVRPLLLRGIYRVSFGATIWSPDADRGSILQITCEVRRNGVVFGSLVAMREQDIEQDGYFQNIQITKENVAATAIIELEEGDAVVLKNTSAGSLGAMYGTLAIDMIQSVNYEIDTSKNT